MKKISFDVKDVLSQLTQVASIVAAKNTMPILRCVKFETKNVNDTTLLKMTTSDGETWVSAVANIDGDEGINVCMAANDILHGLQNLSDSHVTLEIDEEKNTVICHYGKGFFRITCESSNEFPIHKIAKDGLCEFDLQPKNLFSYIKKVSFATNNDELRPVLNSIHFDFFDDNMIIVATDGQRLAKITDGNIKNTFGEIKSLNLPTKPSMILSNALTLTDNDVKCRFNDKVAVFSNPQFKLSTRLIEGRYPNYNSVIPKDNLKTAIIAKDNFISAIKRVSPMGNSLSELITLTFTNNALIVKTENDELSKKAEETISCEYSGVEMTIGFKYSYLLQGLQSVTSEKVLFNIISPERACIISPESMTENLEYLCLLMPLRID